MTALTPQQKLQNKIDELRKYVGLLVTEYDDGRITRAELDARVGIMCKDSLSTVFDYGFSHGVECADIDDSVTEDETDVDIDFGFNDEV